MPIRYVLKDNYWKMRIDHPYSMFAYNDQLGCTCGQAPISETGQVLYPGDLKNQCAQVASVTDRIFSDADLDASNLERVVIFTSETVSQNLNTCVNQIGQNSPTEATVYCVSLPKLFYDDLLVEVDYYAIPDKSEKNRIHTFCIQVEIDPQANSLDQNTNQLILSNLDDQLIARNLNRMEIVKMSCYAPVGNTEFWDAFSAQRLKWFPHHIPAMSDVVTVPATGFNQLTLDVTCIDISESDDDGITVVGKTLERGHPQAIRCQGLLFSSSLFHEHGTSQKSFTVTEEVKGIMEQHRRLLKSQNMDFNNVIKATTFYEGSGSAQALHENMSARNDYYNVPGPASTGLPVSGFPYPGKRTSIELIAASANNDNLSDYK